MISDRRRTAIHEAGHAVADVVLGRAIEYISIRPGRTFGGVAVPAPRDPIDTEGFDPSRVVATQPAAIRADVERRVIASLAGQLAALYLAFEPGRATYTDDEVEVAARRALEAIGPRLSELVVAHEECDEPTDPDEVRAHSLATAMAGPEAGVFYLEWLRAEAHELVVRYAAAILRVADALERDAVLSGDEVATLVSH